MLRNIRFLMIANKDIATNDHNLNIPRYVAPKEQGNALTCLSQLTGLAGDKSF